MWSLKRTHISMTLVDPYVVCEKNTHAMTLVVVSKKNTHAITLVDPCVVSEATTHFNGTGGSDRKSTRLNSSHGAKSRMPSSA